MSKEHQPPRSERRLALASLIIFSVIGMGSLGYLVYHFGPYGSHDGTTISPYIYPRLLQISFNPPQYLNDWLIIQANITGYPPMTITETDQILGVFAWQDPISFRFYNESYTVSLLTYMPHVAFVFSVHKQDSLRSQSLGNWSFVLGSPPILRSLTPKHMPTVAICLTGPCSLTTENQ